MSIPGHDHGCAASRRRHGMAESSITLSGRLPYRRLGVAAGYRLVFWLQGQASSA
jgi:hypothetical protein